MLISAIGLWHTILIGKGTHTYGIVGSGSTKGGIQNDLGTRATATDSRCSHAGSVVNKHIAGSIAQR